MQWLKIRSSVSGRRALAPWKFYLCVTVHSLKTLDRQNPIALIWKVMPIEVGNIIQEKLPFIRTLMIIGPMTIINQLF